MELELAAGIGGAEAHVTVVVVVGGVVTDDVDVLVVGVVGEVMWSFREKENSLRIGQAKKKGNLKIWNWQQVYRRNNKSTYFCQHMSRTNMS